MARRRHTIWLKPVVLVGEAAEPVIPLTGEMAAAYLIEMFAAGDLSLQKLAGYDESLRQRFQALFLFCDRIHGLLPYRPLLNRLVKAAARQSDLQALLINIVLGNQDVATGISRRVKLKAVPALAFADLL